MADMKPNFDPCVLEESEKMLKERGPVEVTRARRGLIDYWSVGWIHGTMDLQNSDEKTARCTAALFCYLYDHGGLPVGLARDLACSYFDPRIGRRII